jgi:dTDP-4-dehydrorhamnose 3,5-epimerase
MRVIETTLPDVLILEPRVFEDDRGFFFESYNRRTLGALGIDAEFVQDNHSRSRRGVLRGLHYQIRQSQGKLVRVTTGEIFDVAVDLRRRSATYGRWCGTRLSADNRCQLWIPPGFAHGFIALSEQADVLYKATDYYASDHERCIAWNDPDIAIDWPLPCEPILSGKDRQGVLLKDAEVFP